MSGVLLVCAVAGCHSRAIRATVTNATASSVSVIQVDYPSASFGIQTLAPGQSYAYRFKVLGAGSLRVHYTDAAHQEHSATGPELHEGDDGALQIVIAKDGVHWEPGLVRAAR